ncbi:histidine phosphatase family protein [uncultured Thiodictyon sp.]|jgi:phosphohistidine phosphatase SixA|uniref:histidine phosphatase family protein n=1 Tax=uncultured Thiodictyon sp. TaxID=1846217 RepID=UPI0025FF6EC7|nr:histidine phosphatase family protein [uncultured Thiodictyon sp.]
MICAAIITCCAADGAVAATCTNWPATVYLLRHAEKTDSATDPPLSPAGWQRAGGLPAALAGVKVDAIFVSDQRRTQQTAMSLAADTGVKPVVLGQNDVDKLVRAICKTGANPGSAVVVVGHTTNLLKVMAEIGVTPGAIPSKGPDFGDLFVVDPKAHNLKHLRYGDCQ